jgi:hypothetical protein
MAAALAFLLSLAGNPFFAFDRVGVVPRAPTTVARPNSDVGNRRARRRDAKFARAKA